MNSWTAGDELSKQLLTVFPKVDGKVVALDSRTIAFVPKEGFDQDTAYTFRLALDEILQEIPEEQASFSFGIRTLAQQFNVYTNAIQSYSREFQYIEGQLKSSDELSLTTVKKLIKAEQKGKSVSLRFDETNQKGTQFYFKIDSIRRFENDEILEVTWDGTPFDIESSGKNNINIPGKNNFTCLLYTSPSPRD